MIASIQLHTGVQRVLEIRTSSPRAGTHLHAVCNCGHGRHKVALRNRARVCVLRSRRRSRLGCFSGRVTSHAHAIVVCPNFGALFAFGLSNRAPGSDLSANCWLVLLIVAVLLFSPRSLVRYSHIRSAFVRRTRHGFGYRVTPRPEGD
jgi:hypothetical protein